MPRTKKPRSVYDAAESLDLDEVRRLLQTGADPGTPDSIDRTPLHAVAARGHVELASLLLDAGADVNARDYRSFTPLHAAARAGAASVVELLLSRGADPRATNTFQKTPLHEVADRSGQTDDAARVGIATSLLDAGADINATGNDATTPLCSAAEAGSVMLVEALLFRGADPNPEVSALAAAKEGSHTEVERLLREHGARE